MAIVWSDEYPGQIAIDPAWPHGKPRNVAVPGDGSGTPLEAAWVSDLAGWQAALLDEAGITPSGDPDKLGASDYTEAIKAIAGGTLLGFTSTPHTWTAQQIFTSGSFAAGDWGVWGEVKYVNGVTGAIETRPRTLKLPLSGFVPSWDLGVGGPSWRFYATDDGTQVYWDMVSAKSLVGFFRLPHEATISSVRAGVHAANIAGVGGTLQMTVGLYDDLEGFAGSEQLSAFVWGTTVSLTDFTGVMTALPPSSVQVDGSRHTLAVRFVAPSGGQCRVYWGKGGFADPGPRNF